MCESAVTGMALKVTRIAVALLLGFILAAHPAVALSRNFTGGKNMLRPLPKVLQDGVLRGVQWFFRYSGCACPCPFLFPKSVAGAAASTRFSLLTLPSLPANEYPPRFSSSVPMTAVPLFQRDCCYLL